MAPNTYWIAQQTRAILGADEHRHTTRFELSALGDATTSRNRCELITDFPVDCDPDNINTLSPHPLADVVASRATNYDERMEWTCVHDLRLPPRRELAREQRPAATTTVLVDNNDVMGDDWQSLYNAIQSNAVPGGKLNVSYCSDCFFSWWPAVICLRE
jgi:hypothetical protein